MILDAIQRGRLFQVYGVLSVLALLLWPDFAIAETGVPKAKPRPTIQEWTRDFAQAVLPFINIYNEMGGPPHFCGRNGEKIVRVCYPTESKRTALISLPNRLLDLNIDQIVTFTKTAPTEEAAVFANETIALVVAVLESMKDVFNIDPFQLLPDGMTEWQIGLDDYLARTQKQAAIELGMARFMAEKNIVKSGGWENEDIFPVHAMVFHITSAQAALSCYALLSDRPDHYCEAVYGYDGRDAILDGVKWDLDTAQAQLGQSDRAKDLFRTVLEDRTKPNERRKIEYLSSVIDGLSKAEKVLPDQIERTRIALETVRQGIDWKTAYGRAEHKIWRSIQFRPEPIVSLVR